MSDGLTVSIFGDAALVAELEAAALDALPLSKAIVSKGALNIKKDWQQRWQGIAHARALPSSITYDTRAGRGGGWIEAEIGPVEGPDRQGFLGPIIEFGGIHNAPNPGGLPALEAELPRFEAAINAASRTLLP